MIGCVAQPERGSLVRASSRYSHFIADASRSADAVAAAVADNCRFDERASEERWQAFEAMLPDLPGDEKIEWRDWAGAYQRHLDETFTVPRPSVPDAFLPANQRAWLDGLAENQWLVRIEGIDQPLRSSALELDELVHLLERADDDAKHTVRSFIETWNQARDARPAFAAFADEVQVELDDDDWPHALRDRLGLGHYGAPGDTPQPVALMRYPLADVYAAQERRQIANAVALPTVLDGGMHKLFFPVPREHPYGATVHLVPQLADTLTAEVLHCRIDYERQHISRVGEITRPAQLDHQQLREARDLHLYALREVCDRDDFGEPLEGRT